MSRLKQLQNDKNTIVAEMRRFIEECRDENGNVTFSAEQQEKYDAMDADVASLNRQISIEQRIAEHEASLNAADEQSSNLGRNFWAGRRNQQLRLGQPTDEQRALALQGFMLTGTASLTGAHLEAMAACGIDPHMRSLTIPLFTQQYFSGLQTAVQRGGMLGGQKYLADLAAAGVDIQAVLNPSVGGDGGYLIPPGTLASQLEVTMLAQGDLLTVCDTITTATGEPFEWPVLDDDNNEGEILAFDTDSAEGDPDFESVPFGAHELSSKLIRIPRSLLDDSAFNLPEQLGAMLGERIGRTSARYGTVGTGGNQPNGIVPRSTLGFTASQNNDLLFSDFIELEHSVDPAYRVNAGYMMHDAMIKVLRLKEDADGRPLWEDSQQVGTPGTLRGRPTYINQYMASSLAASAKVVLFGDFKQHKRRRVSSITLFRFVELYGRKNQEAFMAISREDWNLVNTKAVKHLKLSSS